MPAEFIGFTKSQTPVQVEGQPVSNHEELMSNFFSQPDALAIGKSEHGDENKFFEGDRPSISLLFKGSLTPFACGQLLSIYEHRVAIEGFLYDINSFDQFGVELGKVMSKDVR